VADSFSVENLEPIRRVFYTGLRVYGAYEPPRSSFERVLFIKCIDQPPDDCYREDDLGWGKYIRGNLVTRRVPGSHSQLMSPEYVSELARQIDESLEGI
jgi:thioesterase domain-containing protein